jgi:hypothetical protein
MNGLFRLELVVPIDYSPDWVELVSARDTFEEIQADADAMKGGNLARWDSDRDVKEDGRYLRIVVYPGSARDYDGVWHSPTQRFAPKPSDESKS